MNESPKTKGPWHHRALIWFFSALLGLLVYWLLGFVVNDIRAWPGPSYPEIEARFVESDVLAASENEARNLEGLTRMIADEKTRQSVLRDSTDNSARTMNQLLEIQRLNVQRGVTPTEVDQAALRDAGQLFLTNQVQYQQGNDRIAQFTESVRISESRRRDLEERLEAKRIPARMEYQRLETRHQLKLAALKLGILVPLLAVAVVAFVKLRGGLYSPAIYAVGIAVLAKVLLVMHEHFPRRYFKYLLILAALLLVGRILIYLVRAAAFPKRDWLLKQYREAYEHHFCPVCSYPIRRGPLRFAFWTRRSLKRLLIPPGPATESETPYTCPVCGTRLYEECGSCHSIRHSLLPACVRCGAPEKDTLPG